MVAKEIAEWSDDKDFYSNNGNGEAEEVVIQEMINWFKREFSKQIEESDFAALEDEIKATYQSLN
jgi:beta-lactamase class D